jgi:hypothetical protein
MAEVDTCSKAMFRIQAENSRLISYRRLRVVSSQLRHYLAFA